MSLPIHNTKKLLYAVWLPNGNEILVTSASNVNTLIDVRKEVAVKSLPSEIEVCSNASCTRWACRRTALTEKFASQAVSHVLMSGCQNMNLP